MDGTHIKKEDYKYKYVRKHKKMNEWTLPLNIRYNINGELV